MSGTNIKPAFQAELVKGRFSRVVTKVHEDVRKVGALNKEIITRTMVQEREEFDEGYMIYCPQGHSIFVPADDVAQLERIGVFDPPPRIDMESGEVVPDHYDLSPKEIVERSTRNRPRPFNMAPRASTGGLTEVLAGTDPGATE
jgi:hypothetical protein